jgi:hypothetical protein
MSTKDPMYRIVEEWELRSVTKHLLKSKAPLAILESYLAIFRRQSFLEKENRRLRDALDTLERLSGLPMEYDEPVRVAARAALEGK